MPRFEPGREKTGGRKPGRPKGSLGVRSQLARDLMERYQLDPLEWLLRRLKSRKTDESTKLTIALHLVQFCHPKLQATHVQAQIGAQSSKVTAEFLQMLHTDKNLSEMAERLSLAYSSSQGDDTGLIEAVPVPEPPADER